MNSIIRKTIFIWLATCLAVFSQELDLANTYFKQGEYDKAAEIYKKLSTNKDQARLIHNEYLATLIRLKDFATADKFLRAQIKNNSNQISYKADLAQLFEISGKSEVANQEYEKLIEEAAKVDAYVYELQNFFYKANKIDLAVKLLLSSRSKSKDPFKFDTQLARAYLYLDQKDKMLEEVLGFGQRSKNYSYVQATIQDNIKSDKEIDMLEKMLYAKIQADPNESFNTEILIWHFTQKADYGRAFIQARALDRRLKLAGFKMFELAGQSFNAKDFKNSSIRDVSRHVIKM